MRSLSSATPSAIAATERLFAALGKGIGQHPRFLGFDLSNEITGSPSPSASTSLHYSEYFIELIKAFHTDLGRKVWIEETGGRPAVVKASRSTDKAYLEARGIDTLIQLDEV